MKVNVRSFNHSSIEGIAKAEGATVGTNGFTNGGAWTKGALAAARMSSMRGSGEERARL